MFTKSLVTWLFFILVAVVFVGSNLLIGGTRLVFAQPWYAIIGVMGCMVLFTIRGKPVPASKLCLTAAGIFLAYILWRGLNSPLEYMARFQLYMALAAAIIYLVTAVILTNPSQRLVLLGVLILLAIGYVVLGARQFQVRDNFMLFGFQRANYDWRASGFLVCPNHMAGFLEMVAVMTASVAFWGRAPVWLRLLLGYVVAVCLGGIAITGSRGGYLSTAAAFLTFLILSFVVIWHAHRERFVALMLAVVTLVGGGLAAVVYFMGKSSFIQGRLSSINDTQNMRWEMWEAGFTQFLLSPIIGTGAWTYHYFSRMFRPPGGYVYDPMHTHNDYVQLLAEYGLVGFVLMVIFVVCHLGHGWDAFKWLVRKRMNLGMTAGSNATALTLGAICCVAAMLCHAVVEFNLQIPSFTLMMAFFFGILANPGMEFRTKEGGSSKAAPGTVLPKLAAAGLGIWLLVLVVPKLEAEWLAEKARGALRDREFGEAIRYAREAQAKDPTNPHPWLDEGEARLRWAAQIPIPKVQQGMYQLAADALMKGVELDDWDGYRMISAAQALTYAGRYDEALPVYKRAIELIPWHGVGYYTLGVHYEMIGEIEKAKASYEQGARSATDTQYARERLKRME